jgi:hypothetical protein
MHIYIHEDALGLSTSSAYILELNESSSSSQAMQSKNIYPSRALGIRD